MNSDQGTELRSGRIISSSLETPVPTDPDMAQSSANDSDSNGTSEISSQLSEIRESYERKINEPQNEFSQLNDLMMAVISKTDSENRPSTSKCPSKPAHTVGLDSRLFPTKEAPTKNTNRNIKINIDINTQWPSRALQTLAKKVLNFWNENQTSIFRRRTKG